MNKGIPDQAFSIVDSSTPDCSAESFVDVGPLQVAIGEGFVAKDGARIALGRPAMSILKVLIANRGQVVSKEALFLNAWSGKRVEENTLHVHIRALRHALGPGRDLLRNVSGRGYVLLEQSTYKSPQAMARLRDVPFIDRLFGRELDVARVLDLVQSYQVVTLTGVSGIGKTSLAIAICRSASSLLYECIRFVPLATMSTQRLAHEAILAAFSDFSEGNFVTLKELAHALTRKKCLLVLDNCEHIVTIVASIIGELSVANSGIRIVVTSQEPLRIDSEAIYEVETLTYPPADATPQSIASTDAVRFFVHRAKRQSVELPSDDATLRIIGEICRRVDGIPLAIELAAARAATLGLEAIRSNLSNRFAILTGGARDVLPRHQTLLAAFDWSYGLLSTFEQTLFRQVGMCVDGFTVEAACSMMEARGFSSNQTTEALRNLTARSLVLTDHAYERRFRQLESIRLYALTRLEDNEAPHAARAHAIFYGQLIDDDKLAASQEAGLRYLHELNLERSNLRSALTWAFNRSGDATLARGLASRLVPVFFALCAFDECAAWALKSLALYESGESDDQSIERIRLLCARAGALVYTDGPQRTVADLWTEVFRITVASREWKYQMRATWGLWNVYQYGGVARNALIHAQEFAAEAVEQGSTLHKALGHRIVGIAFHYAGNNERAKTELTSALSSPEFNKDKWTMTGLRVNQTAVTKATMARVLWFSGETQKARKTVVEAEAMARAGGHELTCAYVLIEASIPIAVLRRDAAATKLAIEQLSLECKRAGLNVWLQCCDVFEYIARAIDATLSSVELEHFENAIRKMRKTGYLAPFPLVAGEFSRALLNSGRFKEAIAVVEEAIAECEQTGSGWYAEQLVGIHRNAVGSYRHVGISSNP